MTLIWNGDDFLHPDCRKTLVHIAEQQKADIVQCGYVRGNDTVFPSVEYAEDVAIHDNLCSKIIKIN